jgi:hypothetical protein
MDNEAVRTALAAGVRAWTEYWLPDGKPPRANGTKSEAMAESVAAFLRALPASRAGSASGVIWPHDLADAVDAAKERA